MMETTQLESSVDAYTRCHEDFEILQHNRILDLEPALTGLEHLVAKVKRRSLLLKIVRSGSRGAAVMNFIGIHQPAGSSSA